MILASDRKLRTPRSGGGDEVRSSGGRVDSTLVECVSRPQRRRMARLAAVTRFRARRESHVILVSDRESRTTRSGGDGEVYGGGVRVYDTPTGYSTVP